MRLGLLYWFSSDGVKPIAICNDHMCVDCLMFKLRYE